MILKIKLIVYFGIALTPYTFAYSPDIGMYNTYQGIIGGKYKITLSILPLKNGMLIGDYVYDNIGKKIKLTGSWNKHHLQINEYNKDTINAKFTSSSFNDNDGVILGHWHNLKANNKLTFKLRHISSIRAINNKRYSSTLSDEKIEAFAKDIKNAVIRRDYHWLSEHLRYPIQVKTLNIKIKNKNTFIKKADLIINEELVSEVRSAKTFFLFSNSDGISLSNGTIWFSEVKNSDPKLKIHKIGSATPIW